MLYLLSIKRPAFAEPVFPSFQQHPIHLHDEPGHASTFRQSIASYVGERFPHIEKTTGPGRVSQKMFVISFSFAKRFPRSQAHETRERRRGQRSGIAVTV